MEVVSSKFFLNIECFWRTPIFVIKTDIGLSRFMLSSGADINWVVRDGQFMTWEKSMETSTNGLARVNTVRLPK